MTVLRPSLPPVSSMTTRMVSFAPGFFDGGAAAAVRLRNTGTLTPSATRPDSCRKSRRFMDCSPSVSCTPLPSGERGEKSVELEFGLSQHQVTQGADAILGGVLGRPVHRHLHLVRVFLVLQESLARFAGNLPLQKQVEEEVDQLLVPLLPVLLGQNRRVAAPAEAGVLRRGQGQGQVLPVKQRLAVEPGRAAIPALD